MPPDLVMNNPPFPSSVVAAHTDSLTALIVGTADSEAVIKSAAALSASLGIPWEAVYVETPDAHREGAAGVRAAEALSLAAKEGGTLATVVAATVRDGIEQHLKSAPAAHLVIGRQMSEGKYRLWPRSSLDRLATDLPGVTLHIVPEAPSTTALDDTSTALERAAVPFRAYLWATALVAATLAVAEVLRLATGTRSLDLIFLFPVIAVAARLGLQPAILAALLSVFSYNFFLLAPALSFDPRAPQNLVMAVVLLVVAIYTSTVTGKMRGRLLLSDRSARENASIAALAQRLTREADWESTALTLCEHLHGLFDVHVAIFRRLDGELTLVAATPAEVKLGPIDSAALEAAWQNGEESGAGTSSVSAADWQFQPLKTSLGTLAVLGLARDDGRDPVRSDRRVLLSTIIAQAALAHERLRLEDQMRSASCLPGDA